MVLHEIELKFQVPVARQAALVRALNTRTAQALDLRATYHDTSDGALAAARLVLRVRREGTRWVQALKGPGDGLLHRLEDEVPLPEQDEPPAPDPALHEGTAVGRLLQQALAGAGGLQPQYTTDIRRLSRVLRHRGARIEAAFDTGAVRVGAAASPVCELELELLEGPLEALLDLATRWAPRFGLVPDPATKSERARWLMKGGAARPVVRAQTPAVAPGVPLVEARAAMLRAALSHAWPNAAAITAGGHLPDHVHQLRVALRRLRSVLRALGPLDPARDAALATLFGALGRTRDADVLGQVLAPAWAAARAAGVEPPASAAPLDDPGPRALAEPTTTALWLQLLALALAGASADEIQAWDAVVLHRIGRWRRSTRRMAAEWSELDDPARHVLRKRVKRLRYLVEFATPLLPKRRAARELLHLGALQEALGQWNDLVQARAHLATQAEPAAWFAAGWLARQMPEVEQLCRSAAAAWCVARDGLRGRHIDR